jgi:hypothetical protein
MILVSTFVLLVAAMATAQLPQPQIIDHQIVTGAGVGVIDATENVQSAFNILEVVVTCSFDTSTPCLTGVVDGNNNHFTYVTTWFNEGQEWGEEIWYLVEPSAGTTIIKAATYSLTASYNILVEQIQGIGNDQ